MKEPDEKMRNMKEEQDAEALAYKMQEMAKEEIRSEETESKSKEERCSGHTLSQWIVRSTENFFQW